MYYRNVFGFKITKTVMKIEINTIKNKNKINE